MRRWSEALVKETVSQSLLDADAEDSDQDLAALSDLRSLVSRKLGTKSAVNRLRSDLEDWKKNRALSARLEEVFSDITEELEEISDDIRWARTRRGRFVLFANDYGQHIYGKIRPNPKFADVYLLADAKQEELVVSGSVAEEATLQELRSIIQEHDPGVPVNYQVTVRPQSH